MKKPAIEVENVRYAYPDGTVGIDCASLVIYEGERVAILGPNGAGKSTLLMLIDGLLKPDRGSVKVFGRQMDEKTAPELRKRMGFVFQDADDELFCPTVKEDLAFGPTQLGLPQGDIDWRVSEASNLLAVQKLIEKPPFRLSEGEKRRAAVAAVLTTKPRILLVDEPTANLDPRSGKALIDLLNKLSKEGVTLVVATQDVNLVPEVADRVYILGSEKRIVAQGPVDEVLVRREILERAGLSVPVLVELFLKLQEAGLVKPGTIALRIEEAVQKLKTGLCRR